MENVEGFVLVHLASETYFSSITVRKGTLRANVNGSAHLSEAMIFPDEFSAKQVLKLLGGEENGTAMYHASMTRVKE